MITTAVLSLAIKVFLVTWFFTQNDWIQSGLDSWAKRYVESERASTFEIFLAMVFYDILSCHKCLSFWILLFITNPFVAIGTSFFAYIFEKSKR